MFGFFGSKEEKSQRNSDKHQEHMYNQEIENLKIQLEEEKEKAYIYKQIIENLKTEGVFLADTESKTGKDGNRITYVNRAGKSIINKASSEIKSVFGIEINADNIEGKSIHIFHKDPDRIKMLLKQLKPGEVVKNADIHIGRMVIQSDRSAITDTHGNIKYYLTTWTDATWNKFVENIIYNMSGLLETYTKLQNLIAFPI